MRVRWRPDVAFINPAFPFAALDFSNLILSVGSRTKTFLTAVLRILEQWGWEETTRTSNY